MKNTIASIACMAALLAVGSAAFAADDAMAKPDAMMAKPDTTMATMLCRPAAAGEKATAMMGTSSIVCKKIDMDKMASMKKSLMSMPGGEPLYLKMFQEYHVGANGV
jgi:hypothetical protein